MKKVYHVLILLFILPLYVSAQQKTISGKVRSYEGFWPVDIGNSS